MNILEAVVAIRTSTGPIAIEFIKRSDGQMRLVRCQKEPPNEGIPTGKRDDSEANRLITVFDIDDNRFKSIPIEGIRRIEINGQWHDVIQPTSDVTIGQSKL